MDIELSDEGKRQAAQLALRLKSELESDRPARIISSDLRRAKSTAMILAGELGVPLEIDERLREIGFGEWEGKTPQEIARKWPDLWAVQGKFDPGIRPPGGESTDEVVERLRAFVTDLGLSPEQRPDAQLHDELPNANIGIVSHAGPVRVLLCLTLGLPVRYANSFAVDNASLSVVGFSRRYVNYSRLIKLNDTSHIQCQ